jgi:glycosyltransferase involved in cell wall biosynthesis
LRTLFATVDPAFPPISGADLRNWQNAWAASRLGPVQLASLLPPNLVCPPDGIEAVSFSDLDRSAPVWGADLDIQFPAGTQARLRGLIDSFAPDAIVFESLAMHPLIADRSTRAARVIIDLHNIESDLVLQDRRVSRWCDWRERFRIRRRVRRIVQIERDAVGRVDCVWVCSATDRERLRVLAPPLANIRIVPNGIPRNESAPPTLVRRTHPQKNGPTLIFIGHLSYPPNIEAARMLIDLMPGIRRRFPAARLLLVGRNPNPEIQACAQAGIIDIVADPEGPAKYLAEADFAVMPLQRGGGTRIKALEAMAWGIPMIATRCAVEGLSLLDGVHVRIAESAAGFIAQISALMSDCEAQEDQRLQAYRYVHEHFGPEAILSAIKEALNEGQ